MCMPRTDRVQQTKFQLKGTRETFVKKNHEKNPSCWAHWTEPCYAMLYLPPGIEFADFTYTVEEILSPGWGWALHSLAAFGQKLQTLGLAVGQEIFSRQSNYATASWMRWTRRVCGAQLPKTCAIPDFPGVWSTQLRFFYNFSSFLGVFRALLIHLGVYHHSEAGAQVALLTGSSPPEACAEHFRERSLVHRKMMVEWWFNGIFWTYTLWIPLANSHVTMENHGKCIIFYG